MLTDIHDGPLGGHLGVDMSHMTLAQLQEHMSHMTLAQLQEQVYWLGYHDDLRKWCHCRAACVTHKNPAPTSGAPLTSVKTGYPRQLVAMDIL